MRIHEGRPVLHAGSPWGQATSALILIHGRGASAEDILGLGAAVAEGLPDVALLAPQACENTWYPSRFLAPLADNEPYLASALEVVACCLAECRAGGIAPDRATLAGFSQGACLSLEFVARNPARYGAVVGLSGALIGPPGTVRNAGGSLAGTPVYLGCSESDPHIPLGSVEETAAVLSRMGARVTKSIFPGRDHTVTPAEVAAVRALVRAVSGR